MCYIILDEKYTNENAFKTQIYLYILYQVLYNTKKNNYGQSRDKKTLKKSKWTYILGRMEYHIISRATKKLVALASMLGRKHNIDKWCRDTLNSQLLHCRALDLSSLQHKYLHDTFVVHGLKYKHIPYYLNQNNNTL